MEYEIGAMPQEVEIREEIPAGEPTAAPQEGAREQGKHLIELKTPYRFEQTDYFSIDLSGLERMTINDAVDAQRQIIGEREAAGALLAETTTAFARVIAAKASGIPIEFFKLMPRRVSRLVVGHVQMFFNVAAGTENHIMRLEKPYFFDGKTYEEVDLNGIADLNSMNESAAENRLARAGFVITETSFNYLYACCLASMATGLKEEFFTGLPLRETVKLKNAVNDQDFFE